MRIFSFVYAVIFLVVGFLGVIPNGWPLLSHCMGLSLGYIVTGLWMLIAGFCRRIVIRYSFQVVGIVYAALVILGFFFHLVGTGAHQWFQFIMVVPAVIIGFSQVREEI